MRPLKFMSPLISISGATVERTLSSAIDGGDFPSKRILISMKRGKGRRKGIGSTRFEYLCARACVLGSHKEIILPCHRCGWRRSKIEIKK